MSRPTPYVELGDDFKQYVVAMVICTIFVATMLTSIIGFFALFFNLVSGNWSAFFITLGIFTINLLVINIKRIGTFENPIFIMWRTPLFDA